MFLLFQNGVKFGRVYCQCYNIYSFHLQELPFPSGKMVGGSSSFNSLIYVRGNKKNFDDWEQLGATGWSFKDVFPYFLKLEDNRDPEYLWNGNFSIYIFYSNTILFKLNMFKL